MTICMVTRSGWSAGCLAGQAKSHEGMSSRSAVLDRLVFCGALLLCLFHAAPLQAQTISGRVVDDASDQPLAGAAVALLNAQRAVVSSTISSDSGFFQLRAAAAGRYTVRVQQVGYADHEGQALELAAGEYLEVEVRLSRQVVNLDPVVVVARRPFEPGREGFARRRELGRGLFLDMVSIAVAEPRVTTDVFRGLQGVQVVPVEDGGLLRFSLRSMRGRRCLAVFLDHAADPIMVQGPASAPRLNPGVGAVRGGIGGGEGVLRSPELSGSGVWPYGDLDDLVDPASLRGIEVFRAWNEVPQELRSGLRAPHLQGCGVVLIWTATGW